MNAAGEMFQPIPPRARKTPWLDLQNALILREAYRVAN
jgi:hypothetical protein